FLAGEGVTALTAARADVLAYKKTMESEGKKAATVNAYLTAVRQLYAWLESEGIKPNIAASVKGLRKSVRSSKDALTVAQARAVLADVPAEGATVAQLRDYAIVNLLTRRGLRTVEAARANIEDMRTVNGETVLYVQGKGYADKGEIVVLGESCEQPIRAYLAARGETDPAAPLFASESNNNRGGRMSTNAISQICKAALKAHGIDSPAVTAHSLRHTAVTSALLAGASLQEVQALARHKSINTTMIYAHNLDRMKAGAEHAIDGLLGAA
uniref:tyrosine-type recombinase/integrase n=1 Tax=Paratractidigestivibacter sp. TaxID=2847316 RepID=UPI002ABDA809